jgi:hypothetical protein
MEFLDVSTDAYDFINRHAIAPIISIIYTKAEVCNVKHTKTSAV